MISDLSVIMLSLHVIEQLDFFFVKKFLIILFLFCSIVGNEKSRVPQMVKLEIFLFFFFC